MAKSSSQSEAIDKLIQKLNLIKTGFFNSIRNANNQLEEELKVNVTTEKFSDIVTKSKEILDKFVDFSRSVVSGKTKIANAITEKGVQTDSNGSFENMSENIKKIKTGYSVGENLSSDKVKYKADYKYRLYKTFDINSKALCIDMEDKNELFFGCQDGGVIKINIVYDSRSRLYDHSDYVRDIKIHGGRLFTGSDDHTVVCYDLGNNTKKWTSSGFSGYVMKISVGKTRVWAGTNRNYLYAVDLDDGQYNSYDTLTLSDSILDISVRDGDSGLFICGQDYLSKEIRTMSYSGSAHFSTLVAGYGEGMTMILPWNLYGFSKSSGISSEILSEGRSPYGLEQYSFKKIYCSDCYKNEYVYATKNEKSFIVKIKPDIHSDDIQISELVETNVNNFSVWAMAAFGRYLCLSVQEGTQQKIKLYKLEKTENFEIIK